jgi:hypothetical protein
MNWDPAITVRTALHEAGTPLSHGHSAYQWEASTSMLLRKAATQISRRVEKPGDGE